MEKENLSKFNDLMGDENSKEASRILYFSEKYGVSPYASSFLEKKHKIQVSKDLPDKFWIELENTHPNTVKYLNNPYGLRAISDDFDFMPFYESWAKQFVRGVKYNYLQYKLSDLLGKKYEYAKRNMSLLPEDEEKIKKIKEELMEAEEHAPKPNKFRPIYYASQQSLNIGIPIAVGLGGGAIGTLLSPAGASAGFTAGFLGSVAKITYEQERNFAFDSYVNEYNIDPKKAVELANYVGMINSAIEVAGDYVLGQLVLKPFGSATMRAVSKLPMGEKVLSYISKNKEIFSHMTLSEAVRKAVLSLSGTVASEVAQEYSQEVVTDVGAEIGRRSEGEQPQSIKEILNKASGVINPTIQASLLFGLTGALSNIYIGVKELREAEMTRESYLKLGKVSEKMKLRKMNPKEFEKFVNTAVEETGVEKIYLDVDNAKKYFQSRGIDFGDVIKELGLQDKYDNPENINGYLEVPLGRWLSKVVGSEHYNNLVDHIKFDLEHYTNAELREMEAIAERNIENKINDLKSQVNPEWVENFNVVYNRVSSQLREIYGDKKEKLIDSQAKAFSYMVINEAVKKGISPESFLNEWNLPSITTIEGQIANEVYYKNVTDILNKTSKGEPVENDYIYNKTYNEFKEQDFPEIQKQAKIELDPKTLYKEIIKRAINDGVVLNEKVASQGVVKNLKNQLDVLSINKINEFANQYELYQSPLYHGTAYDFDKFDINKIGSGEGAWVYGWGLYFAENKDVAKHYKKSTEDLIININGEEMRTKIIEDDVIKKICDLAGIDFNKNKMRVSFILNHYINKDFNWDAVRDLYKDNPENLDIVNRISKIMSAKGTGRIMEVGVKGSLKTILWDEGIEKQPPEVLEILQKNGFEIYPSSNIFPEGTISYEHNGKKIYATTGWELYEQLSRVMDGYKNTSKFLASIGIDGIKYKDEGSRLKTDRDSITYNYVIFNPDKIYISRKLEQKKRGYYDVARNVIALSVINSDPSTFMHESAHYFLEDMFNYVKSGKASDKYLKQWEAVKKFLNIKEDQKELTIEQHEKFAKEFEKYLLTSKFENEEIKSFMEYIKNTMSKIYRKFILGKITLNEDMKRFFDSMIVPENIVSSVVHEESSNDFGIDENSKIAEKFKIETANYIMHKLMDYYTSSRQEFLKKEEERIRGEIAKEVEDEPIFNAYDKIKEIIPKEKDVKEFLISKNFNKYEKYKLDVIAEIYGFSSREEMIKEILDNPTREEYIEAKLKEEMKKYDDLNNKEKLVEEVKEAFYKSAKMSIIKKEIEFIKSKLKDKELLNKFKENYLIESEKYQEIVESKARKYISKLPVNEAIRYENLRKYALKMREKSLRYYMKNDFVNALKYKKEEYYYTALSKEAKNVYKEYYLIIKNIKKIIGYLKKNKKEQRKIFYNEDNAYQVAKLVNRFGFVRNHFTIPVDTIPLAKWVEEMNKVTNVVDISEDLFDETKVKPYTSLTIDELRDVHDAMMNIIHTGKLMNMAYGMVSKLDKQMLKEEMKKSFENIKDKLAKDPKLTNKLSIIEKLKEFGNSINLNLATIDSLLYVLDGGERQGAWWRAIYKPINDASDLEAKMIQEAVEKIREIYSVYTKEELISMDKDLIYIDAIKQSLTKNEIMAIALNLGTESNKKRLMEGYGWDEGTIAKITQVLTKKDWDTIQKIWDFIGSYQDDIKSLYKDLTGFTPKMVDPIPVITPYGVYSGGYYPLYKNVKLDARGLKEMQEDRSLLEAPPVWKASTKNSHVKSRYANAKYPVSLDINVFKRHIYQVIHDLTFRKAVMEVNNLLADPEVRGMITKVFGTEGYGIFEDWIKSVAGNNPTPPMEWFERLFRWARKNAVVSTLFWRFSVMFQQFASFPVVLSYDKDITSSKLIKNASSLYTKMIVNYEGYQRLRNEVFRKSSYMASRSETFDRDLNTLFSQMFKNKKSLIDFSISGIAQFDMLVSLPTWLTGYEVGLEKFNGNEEKAIDFADELVRKTQGSGFIKDLPKIMRGSELKRIFTMYYSYMNAMYNLFFVYAMEYRLGVTNTAKFLGKMLGLWVFPSVLSELLSIRYPDSDEDTEDKIKYWFKKIIAYPMQTIPFLRDIIDMLLDRTLGLKGGGYRITPLQDMGENLGNLISTIRKEDAEAMEKVEATTKIASFLVPYPQQFNILLFNFIDYLDGMKPSPKDLTKRRPKKER